MNPFEKKNKARIKHQDLCDPVIDFSDQTDNERIFWIENVCSNFIAHSSSLKEYYRVILEKIWPKGYNIPGPHVSEEEIRDAINNFRSKEKFGRNPERPYLDVFRRVRELQGEEGLTGIIKKGRIYQLVHIDVTDKRIPRISLSQENWELILKKYSFRCANCNNKNVRLDQDHKIPRVRGGSDEINNWQPLCAECNNFKSTSCRSCNLDCQNCAWAYPEKFNQIKLCDYHLKWIRNHASILNIAPSNFLYGIVRKYIEEYIEDGSSSIITNYLPTD